MTRQEDTISIAAVLFDLDGTLLDTADYIYGAFDAALGATGHRPLNRTAYRTVVGQPLDECYQRLAPGADTAALCEFHRAWQVEHLALVRPMPGAREVLMSLSALGIHRAVVTNRSRRSSIASLHHAGLFAGLGAVVSAEDVTRLKPDPEPVLLALRQLGVAPGLGAMVGDTPADISAGRAAGTLTIGVTCGFAGDAIRDARPDRTIARLPDLLACLGLTGDAESS